MPTTQTTFQSFFTVLLVPSAIALAQSGGDIGGDASWVGIITANETDIHCGPNESYYAIATAKKGDFVRINGKRQDWIKIDTSGNVFKDTVGYIKYPATQTTLFEVLGDNGYVKGDIEVLAKNSDSDDLYRSWRPILHLQDGNQVQVIQTTTSNPGTLHREAYVIHTVKMPSTATGWVRASNIERATQKQVSAFKGNVEFELPADLVDVTAVVSETTGTVEGVPTVESKPVRLTPLTLVELEAAWKKITSEPVMGAEVTPLRDMYAELLLENSGDIVVEQIAGGRLKQLDVWAGLQNQRVRIEKLRSDLAKKAEDVTEYQSVVSLFGDYAIAGRLALSNTFDGRLRPFMYRIQDIKSGRTLGYLPVNEDWDLNGLLGETIGVVGENKWNPNWRVRVVDAKKFDVLSPTTATVTPDIQ